MATRPCVPDVGLSEAVRSADQALMFPRYDEVMRRPLIGTIVLPLALLSAQPVCGQAKANVPDAVANLVKCTTLGGPAQVLQMLSLQFRSPPAPGAL